MLRSLSVFLLVIVTAAVAIGGEWTETVTVSGDLRFRHENIDEEGKEMRNRQRVRARIGVNAVLDENMGLEFRLISGSDEPTSANQTLDGAFTTKAIGLDRAAFVWKHADSGLKVKGGKMGVPFLKVGKNQLIWDGDLSPEGMAASWKTGSDSSTLFVNTAGLWIDERSGSENAALMGAQAGLVQVTDGFTVTVGGGMFNYSELDGAIYDDNFFGNTDDGNDGFMYEYKLIELFAELGFEVSDRPVTVFAEFVKNTEADDDEQGYMFGAKLNKAKKQGTWALGYSYRELQADAVMGALTHSDFAGGGTDGKGHVVDFAYQVAPKAQFALTYLVNTRGIENGVDYKRVQADMKFKF